MKLVRIIGKGENAELLDFNNGLIMSIVRLQELRLLNYRDFSVARSENSGI